MDVLSLNQQVTSQISAIETVIELKEAELRDLKAKLHTLKDASTAVLALVEKLDDLTKLLSSSMPAMVTQPKKERVSYLRVLPEIIGNGGRSGITASEIAAHLERHGSIVNKSSLHVALYKLLKDHPNDYERTADKRFRATKYVERGPASTEIKPLSESPSIMNFGLHNVPEKDNTNPISYPRLL